MNITFVEVSDEELICNMKPGTIFTRGGLKRKDTYLKIRHKYPYDVTCVRLDLNSTELYPQFSAGFWGGENREDIGTVIGYLEVELC